MFRRQSGRHPQRIHALCPAELLRKLVSVPFPRNRFGPLRAQPNFFWGDRNGPHTLPLQADAFEKLTYPGRATEDKSILLISATVARVNPQCNDHITNIRPRTQDEGCAPRFSFTITCSSSVNTIRSQLTFRFLAMGHQLNH